MELFGTFWFDWLVELTCLEKVNLFCKVVKKKKKWMEVQDSTVNLIPDTKVQ